MIPQAINVVDRQLLANLHMTVKSASEDEVQDCKRNVEKLCKEYNGMCTETQDLRKEYQQLDTLANQVPLILLSEISVHMPLYSLHSFSASCLQSCTAFEALFTVMCKFANSCPSTTSMACGIISLKLTCCLVIRSLVKTLQQ